MYNPICTQIVYPFAQNVIPNWRSIDFNGIHTWIDWLYHALRQFFVHKSHTTWQINVKRRECENGHNSLQLPVSITTADINWLQIEITHLHHVSHTLTHSLTQTPLIGRWKEFCCHLSYGFCDITAVAALHCRRFMVSWSPSHTMPNSDLFLELF